jgi:predicted amino acid racemase
VSYIEANGNTIIENLNQVMDVCRKQAVSLTVVTKFFTSDPGMVRLLCENGVDSIADTNAANFARSDLVPPGRCKRSLIKTTLKYIRRIPGLAPAHRADRIFVSDETLLAAVESLPESLRPETVLVAEAGDLRDGFYMEDIPAVAARYRNARICGLSANLGCLSGKMPDAATVRKLAGCAAALPQDRNRNVPPTVSVGGTVVYKLLESGALTGAATELRMGEGIFFGYDSSSALTLEGFGRGAFTLYGEIVEIREKMIAPVKNAGHTAFGGVAAPRKSGRRRCAVLDFGLLGASMYDIKPLDGGVETAGQTYDFTVADITESGENYRTGGFIPFRVMYAAAARLFLNPYIERVLV